jgi:release factor glutamine methyltransferase
MTSLLSDTADRLVSVSDTAFLDASVLLAHILKKPRTWVLAHTEDLVLTEEQQKQLNDSLARLESGEPFPYLLGHWEFFGLDFDITTDVLIPRPETELLVEKAIAWLQKFPARRTVADIGTGSGAIAISIAVNIPDVRVLATDISPQALQVAQRNARKFEVDRRVEFIQCDLFPPRPELFTTKQRMDLLCANLPYIPTGTLHKLPIYGREPTIALDGGEDGLALFRRIMKQSPEWLAPNSLILLEIEATRGTQALNLANDMFSDAVIRLHKDLTGLDRLLEIAN